jgi:hypothetical protein
VRQISLIALSLALLGCQTSDFSPVTLLCPSIVTYSAEFQIMAAEELQTLPPGSPVAELVRDYGQLRDRIRVCQDGNGKL